MLRKISTIFLSGVILLSISACGKKEETVKDNTKNLTVHIFCKDKECDDVNNYINTIDKNLKVEKHDISLEKELMNETLKYFDIKDNKTPITIINDQVILGFDEKNKQQYEEIVKEEKEEKYQSIVEKLKDGESIKDIQESIKKEEESSKKDDDQKPEVKPQDQPSSKKNIEYTVKKGDHLTYIARLYNTTWNKIYEDNKTIIGNNPNLIKPGQKLTIADVSSTEYTVKKGDNLSYIAKSYNTTWNKIYEDNKSVIGNNPNLIKPGQKLIINN